MESAAAAAGDVPNPSLDTLKYLDAMTSPVKNPVGVAVAFNLIMVLLIGCIAFLLFLEDGKTQSLWVFVCVTVILWMTVNYVLLQVFRQVNQATTSAEKTD